MKRVWPYLILLFLPLCAWAEPQGQVRLSIDTEKQYWVGQRVLVHLELLTTAFSFSEQRFELPRIDGGVLIQTDSSTIKLTERIDGEQWQILRYDLSFFAQREGDLEIPPLEVHFSASAGYGQPTTRFDLKTDPLTLQTQMPPGADPSQPVVTSPRLDIDEQWQPARDGFKVGDALTRTLSISAVDVSAIALPAMPQQRIDGIELLSKPPLVEDKTARGSLTGRRQERISYLFQQSGSYELPAWRISWWNPQSEQLEQHEFQARRLEIAPNPAAQPQPGAATSPARSKAARWWPWALSATALIALAAAAVRWTLPLWRRRQAAYLLSEPARYKRALAACRGNDPAQAYQALSEWLSSASVSRSAAFEQRWTEMQLALVSSSGNWSGRALADTLPPMRSEMLGRTRQDKRWNLAPINPKGN
ncbi:MAG: hypothetical protein ABFR65_02340 [Pseudomonadota bacterium]